MSKIVCEICGTTYPESANQCPICGSAKPVDMQSNESGSGAYTYVKGGRFSKSNVRKRNRGKEFEREETVREEKKDSGSRGLIITAVVLMLAVLAVVGYITVRFFFPAGDNGTVNVEQTIPCESITVVEDTIVLFEVGSTAQIRVTVLPENSTDKDKIYYCPDDISIATVNGQGLVTAVAPGSTIVTVECGLQSAQVTVVCDFPEETEPSTETEPVNLNLLYKELELTTEGAEYIIYAGETAATEIFWASEDTTIATVENGVVKAVGEGLTIIHAEYNGVKASCKVKCEFKEEDVVINGSGGGIGEDGGDNETQPSEPSTDPTTPDASSKNYGFFTLWNSEVKDVTLKVGEALVLNVKDGNGSKVDAVFTISDETICSIDGNTITGLATGGGKTGTLTATVNGKTITCIVRIG